MKHLKTTRAIVQVIILILFFSMVSIIYFSFPVIVMPDSIEYYGYLKIFYKLEPFANWNVVRGPGFPIILYIITLLFGNSHLGLLIGTFLFYVFMILLSIYFMKKINYKNIFTKVLAYSIFIILIILNPIVLGYMHGLLTEFVAIPLLMISTILSLKWIEVNKKSLKIILPICLSINCIFAWFLKQPYVFEAFAPILIAATISIFENKKIKNIIYRISIVIVCIASILLSNTIWNHILIKKGVNVDTGRDTGSFIKAAIINGNTSFCIDFYKNHYEEEYILTTDLIVEKDKKEIMKILNNESQYQSFVLINVFKNFESREEENIKEQLVMFSHSREYTITDAIKTYFKLLSKYPLKTIEAYTLNYLAISNTVASVRHKDANVYYPSMKEGFYYENKSIGCGMYNTPTNMLWVNENHPLYSNVAKLGVSNNKPDIIVKAANKLFPLYNKIYAIVTVILPISLIISVVKRKKNNEQHNKYIFNSAIILLGSAFIHVLFHAVTGAIIDRYGFVVFPSAIIGSIIILFNFNKKDNNVLEQYICKKGKILTIIPAYNEAQNIENVIKELKEDFSETDILVIDDSSTDDTKEIVTKNDINCITTVFNLNYAYAVQTGIKYAKRYNYDYCLMFDGDGQHIAKEAKKLLEKMRETNCDIVIGSRYLEKGNYKAPKLRKIGTSIFTWIIKISCHQKISDPLSGFQIINKRVINKYSKMGEYPEFPDANLIIEMLLSGYKVEEVSVRMRNREFGESMHGGIIRPIKYMVVMLYTILLIILNKIFGRSK